MMSSSLKGGGGGVNNKVAARSAASLNLLSHGPDEAFTHKHLLLLHWTSISTLIEFPEAGNES